ncbi:Nucleotide-binding universal stress protein, UspA family [Nakamurella panacisegetis]|uniref:Nucleotide-binding universal stress protein, UspA family n=1 Tax=Nakamurella panacisegetis TaxID=1090615 RepID=A0A1H0LU21_9ACTN|nr:universal stress protein [Nakamurella panacisegetis]SDO71674.1 Nucleotide-binding universal stress protein, UspA family [Nakamurella panacisegetis]
MTIEESNRTVLVGIDGSANSLAALRWALREGAATGSPVEVVHCWIPQTLTDVALGSSQELQVASACMLQNEVAAALADVGPDPVSGRMPVVTQLSRHGNPTAILPERSAGARLLVLGARTSTALSDLFRGNVESACRRHAACPVVVVDERKDAVRHHPAPHTQAVSQ